jgi:hypothetical protein
MEDRATLGSDPSAIAGGYTDGGPSTLLVASLFIPIWKPIKR